MIEILYYTCLKLTVFELTLLIKEVEFCYFKRFYLLACKYIDINQTLR